MSERRIECAIVAAVLSAALVTTALCDSIDALFREAEEEMETRLSGRGERMEKEECVLYPVPLRVPAVSFSRPTLTRCGAEVPSVPADEPAALFGRLYDHSPPAAALL